MYAIVFVFNAMQRRSRIYARKADSVESFVLRNKDDLVKAAITGLVGVVVGILVQRYVLK